MRSIGYRVVDVLVEHWASLHNRPAMHVSSRESLESKLREDLPRKPSDFDAVMKLVVDDVFTSIGYLPHPRFFGFIPTPSNWVSAMADALAAGVTPFCGTWLEGSGAIQIELVTLDWLKQLLGFPESTGGLFVSGGSIANLTALAAARDAQPDIDMREHAIYYSDQTHSSIDRALKILGYRNSQIRRLETDESLRLDLDQLQNAIRADIAGGRKPHLIVANAGTTNTGAVDPLSDIAQICRKQKIWMHVDGAYGAAAAISGRGAKLLEGIASADSITLDPHKWLFQPYAIGCVLVRDTGTLRDFFHAMPEYLQDAETERGEINLCDYGPELTRPFRALKLWMSLKVFGADAFARAVEHGISLAESVQQMLTEDACWQLISPAQLGIVCFRYVAGGMSDEQLDELNSNIARGAAEDGCCFLSTTQVRDRTVLRMCTIQPSTTEDDLRMSIGCLKRFGERLSRV
jgi:glutamate/tyrosine decarboxylase-like PLP-dependent enzyme